MKAARITEPMKVEIIETDKPVISEGQMLIKTKIASICGSDMPFFLHQRPMNYPLEPGDPGHECTGVVVESRCKEYKEGDEVLSLPIGSRGFAEYFATTPGATVRLPDGNKYDGLVVAQPLGTVLHACRKIFHPLLYRGDQEKKLNIESWDLSGIKVAIVGQGSIGLLFTAMMRIMKADTIIGIDPLEYRLEAAVKLGATHIINNSNGDGLSQVRKITNNTMSDLAIEAVGKVSTINDCFGMVKRSGMILAFGVPRESIYQLSFPELFNKEQRLVGSLGPNVQLEFPPALDLITNGEIDVSHIVTHRLPFEDIQKAFEMAANKTHGAIKILLMMDSEH